MIDVREKHGVCVDVDKCVVANEREQCVEVKTFDGSVGRSVFLSPNEARHVATKLRRLATRIENRLMANGAK